MAVKSDLLSLVFTDLVDSTALKMRQGDHKAGALVERHQKGVRALTVETGGREVDTAGDGFFLTFETPSAAVTFALRLQQIHYDEPELPKVRVGVHLGEVTERPAPAGAANPLFIEGLAVDLAGRIQSLAQGGQILMSGAVFEAARQRLKGQPFDHEISWLTHGPYSLKGIADPVEIGEAGFEGLSPLEAPADSEKAWRVAPQLARRTTLWVAAAMLLVVLIASWALYLPPTADETLPGFGRPAIAVLPFDNLGGGSEQSIFAGGLGEDLITRLASWRSFPVIARGSSSDPDLPKDIQQVGRELGARYVVEGSVRQAGDQIRIVAQLIDATTGHHVWAHQYDRGFSDLLALQDEISEAIVGAMNPALLHSEMERAMREDPGNLDAWNAAMQGWWHFDQFTAEDMAEARKLFEKAVELDPQWGYAYAGLSLSHFYELAFGWTDSPERALEVLVQAAQKAVTLDELSAEAHHALGHAFSITGQADRMIGAFRAGVELNPSHHLANNCYGYHLAWIGRPEEAIEYITRAMSLSPREPMSFAPRLSMSWAYFAAADYEQAVEWAEESIQRAPQVPFGYLVAAASAGHLGDLDRAQRTLKEGSRLRPITLQRIEAGYAVATPDFRQRLIEGLRKAGWEG